jgi:hypothetical protein
VDAGGSRPAYEIVEAEQQSECGCDCRGAVGWTQEIDEKHRGSGEDEEDCRGAGLETVQGVDGEKDEEQTGDAGDDPAGAVEFEKDEEEAQGEDEQGGVRGEMREGGHGWGLC